MSLNAVMPIYTAQSGMVQAQQTFEKAAESIASGVNSYVNPADSYVADGLDTTIRSAQKAIENAQTGYNFTAMADSALSNVNDSMQRIRDLAMQASNGVYSASQRAAIQDEIDQNVQQIKQTLGGTTFNGKQVLNAVTPDNPNPAPNVDFLVGSDTSAVISYDPNVAMGGLNFDVSTPDAARASLAQADAVIKDIGSKRGEIGATAASFEGAVNQQMASISSSTASLSAIRDTDYISAILDMKKAAYTQEAMVKVMKAVMNSEKLVLKLLQ